LPACLLALKEEVCHGGSSADNLRCCSPVFESFSDINVNYVNVREEEDGDWRVILLGYSDETDWVSA
jgi:hypothetical protein